MIKVKQLVDGGYLSWVYGASTWGTQQWSNGAFKKYQRSTGSLILMDSSSNLRKEYDPEYKKHRAERFAVDEERASAKERVDLLRREIFSDDPRVHTFEIEGLEADDLIACFIHLNLINSPVPVIGVDKDLLQLPITHLAMRNHRGKEIRLSKFLRSLPEVLKPYVEGPREILLTLALYGDKSDNVAKIIGRSKELIPVFNDPNPFSRAYSLYGNRFLKNLWLVLLPYPGILDPIPEPKDLPRHLDSFFPNWVGGDFKINSYFVDSIDNFLLHGDQVYE